MKAFRPTTEWIETLQVGDLAPDVFGNISPIIQIYAQGHDIHGKAYVCYYVSHGDDGGMISHSLKADEIDMSLPMCAKFKTRYDVPESDITDNINEVGA